MFQGPPDWQEILTYFRGSELQNYFTKVLEDDLKVRGIQKAKCDYFLHCVITGKRSMFITVFVSLSFYHLKIILNFAYLISIGNYQAPICRSNPKSCKGKVYQVFVTTFKFVYLLFRLCIKKIFHVECNSFWWVRRFVLLQLPK